MACNTAPELPGFDSGGFAGFECPPASEPDGSCGDPDCGVGCVANTPCTPAQATCPLGTTCDAAAEYCMPTKVCNASSAECGSGEYCAHHGMSKGLCVLVDPAPTPCATGGTPCAWPFRCSDGLCKLFCDEAECPSGSACVEGRCEPAGAP